MKKILLVGFVLLTQLTFGQTTIQLADFDNVKTFDKLNVTFIASDENKAVITGISQDKVEVVNKNGLLKIRMPLTKMMTGDEAQVTLYFKKIQSIDANEGSTVTCDDTFKQTNLDLSTQEGASITVVLDVEKTSIKAHSGGIIKLSGNAVTQSVSINSGGIVEASELETSQTTVIVSAGGNADVKATALVDAKVKAGGTITIYGKPKEIRQETFMGGNIVQK
ncbi:head GIN domain-containing protein [Flavobacterium sp.]|uniref:head GIN domain-containing protein n=1 Tax=Flavobacterium sp. TaxID=239 RepID=UPI002BEF7B30|nr:head GIN domain-containing protein [Flavobacterium sp.]HSD09150.1 head GIN domain-containing protein [Flavobacterium sp.]